MKYRWRSRRFRRYVWALMIFLVSCLGGFLWGSHWGRQHGLKTVGPVLMLYDIEGMFPASSIRDDSTLNTVDDLVTLLKSEAALKDWTNDSSLGMIKTMPDDRKLLVHGNRHTHEVVAGVLRNYRRPPMRSGLGR